MMRVRTSRVGDLISLGWVIASAPVCVATLRVRWGSSDRAIILAPRVYLIVDSGNIGSLRAANSVGAVEAGPWMNPRGRTMPRHELRL